VPRWQALRALGPAAPLLVIATVGPLLGAIGLAATTHVWSPWLGPDAASAAAFFAAGALATAGCLLPTHATSLVAGFVFGPALGIALGWLVVVSAAALSYALWAPLVGERGLRALAGSPRAERVRHALLGRGFWRTVWLIALVRLSPALPFAATNLMLPAVGVGPRAFFAATVLGTTPRTLGVAWIGAELATLDLRAGPPGWATALAIGATVMAIAVIGRIAARALRQETGAGLTSACGPARPGRSGS
jgi:uncharacterized membrane protein YdjX (TVP38/TMEM64 family)